jgi:hypothetical protein
VARALIDALSARCLTRFAIVFRIGFLTGALLHSGRRLLLLLSLLLQLLLLRLLLRIDRWGCRMRRRTARRIAVDRCCGGRTRLRARHR